MSSLCRYSRNAGMPMFLLSVIGGFGQVCAYSFTIICTPTKDCMFNIPRCDIRFHSFLILKLCNYKEFIVTPLDKRNYFMGQFTKITLFHKWVATITYINMSKYKYIWRNIHMQSYICICILVNSQLPCAAPFIYVCRL